MDISKYLHGVQNCIGNLDPMLLSQFADHLTAAYEGEKTIFIIGNGGSAANASHFAQDITKGIFFNKPVAKTIKALSLTDNIAHISAIANDDGYEKIFSAQLNSFANNGDYLVCISGSGNSKNIMEAVAAAKQKNIFVDRCRSSCDRIPQRDEPVPVPGAEVPGQAGGDGGAHHPGSSLHIVHEERRA